MAKALSVEKFQLRVIESINAFKYRWKNNPMGLWQDLTNMVYIIESAQLGCSMMGGDLMEHITRSEWLLFVLYTSESLSPLQIQKSLFLLSKDVSGISEKAFYQFEPYDYGPFDSDIYTESDRFEEEGLVSIDNPKERGMRRYRITKKGSEYIEPKINKLEPDDRKVLDDTVAFVKGQSFSSLVHSIYKRFPEFKENSVFSS